MVHKTPEELVLENFEFLLVSLKELKPNDRSDKDRYWAITNTEVEKALAIFKTYVAGK